MEGLLIHALLRGLLPELPALNLGLAFPNEGTLAVLLKGQSGRIFNLVLHYRPPNPSLVLEEGTLLGEPKTPFQRQLSARVKGPLVAAEQLKLDRVVFLHFAGEKGFVDTPPSVLVFEATGRNANLLLLDEKGILLGVDRVITQEVNRYRELKPGLPYTPHPLRQAGPENPHGGRPKGPPGEAPQGGGAPRGWGGPGAYAGAGPPGGPHAGKPPRGGRARPPPPGPQGPCGGPLPAHGAF
ncbi:NFACT family protein [Thermus brockianus]|uniref:NFACT family protein n=1 Tax=Thermus brockianus TaxID=56956 RepID=UPI000AA11F1D|nr:NFACT family protein [Thermus brockianus]